ncbi:MAG: HEAT repeat domain-containing protein [Planctomycetes bacterium]|nr:HEAT repeat domain-containing protein [Planctomycetota bacterium]
MANTTSGRRSSRMRQPVSKGVPGWVIGAAIAGVIAVILIAVVLPMYEKAATISGLMSTNAEDRAAAKGKALEIGSMKLLDPLVVASGQCPPEAAVDYMETLIKLAPQGSSDYMKMKVRRIAEGWAEDESAEKRLAGAMGLTAYFSEENRRLLMLLIKDEDLRIRQTVAANLTVKSKVSAEVALAGIDDKDLQVRRNSADALMKIAVPSAAELLLAKAAKTDDVGMKATILRALAKRELAMEVGAAGFVPFLKDASVDVRKEAIVGIAMSGSPTASDLLIRALDDPSADVRHEVVWNAMCRRDGKVALAATGRLLTEPSSMVKEKTLKTVGPLNLRAAKDNVIALALKKDETPEIRIKALGTILSLKLTKMEERYPVVEVLLPVIFDADKEVSDKAKEIASALASGKRPTTPDGWKQWVEDKKKLMAVMKRIESTEKAAEQAMKDEEYKKAETLYLKTVDLMNEAIELCTEREKEAYWARQTSLNRQIRHAQQKASMQKPDQGSD